MKKIQKVKKKAPYPVGAFASGMQIFQAIKLDEKAANQSESVKFGYALIGPQNRTLHLMRTHDYPHLMIAVDLNAQEAATEFLKIVFNDQEGVLKIAS